MNPIRTPRPTDPDVFICIDFDIPRAMTYQAGGETRRFKHIRAITPRNIGKSYAAITDAVETALTAAVIAAKNGQPARSGRFIYMRRGVDELDTAFPTILKEASMEFPGFEFRVKGRAWEAKPLNSPPREWRTICYGVALAETYKMRSTAWPDVDLIIFDEFIDDGSRPLSQEETRFQSFYDTVARNRDVPTLFLANPQLLTPGVSNPYFVADGLRVTEKMPEYVRFRNKSTIYWFPPMGKFGNQKVTARQAELGDGDYAAMATGGSFVHAMGVVTGKRPRFAEPFAALTAHGRDYSIWVGEGDELFAERGAPKTEDIPRLALSPRDVRRGVRHATWGDPTLSTIRDFWRVGSVVFEDTALREELEPFMLR